MPGRENRLTRQRRFRSAAWLVLIVGLAVSAWIFRTAEDDTSDVIGYVVADGRSYPVTTRDSKQYRHNLERFGGKMAVFADDLNRWIRSLTEGRRLAVVIAVSSFGVAALCFRASRKGKIPETKKV